MKIETTFELDGEDLKKIISDCLITIGYKIKESENTIDISINTNDEVKSGQKRSWGYLSDGVKMAFEIEKI